MWLTRFPSSLGRIGSATRRVATVSITEQRVPVHNGVVLQTLSAGDASDAGKTPLVCLPSALGFVAKEFEAQLEQLSAQFPVVAVDFDGFNDKFPEDFLTRNAKSVAGVLQQLGHDQVNVLGCKEGANVAAVFAALYPDKVRRLILVDGNAFVNDEEVEALESLPQLQPAAALRQELITRLKQMVESEGGGDLYCSLLPQIQCKTLVVASDNDPVIASFHGEYLSERILHSRLQVVETAPTATGSLLMEKRDELNRIVREFLQEPDDKLTQSREFVAMPAKK